LSGIPAYITLSDVISHLNVQGSGPNYTVYGLPLSSSAMQAHVDHANKYIYSLVPNLTDTSDVRYLSAQLAALDIACIGILVTSVGGAMVGAYDYFLGDMRVSRSGPYASAIEKAIAGYSQSARQNITNVTLAAASAKASMARNVPRRPYGPYGWPLS
jgi:hypothetical protein